MIQTGQGKLNEGFFLDSNGLWTMRTRTQLVMLTFYTTEYGVNTLKEF